MESIRALSYCKACAITIATTLARFLCFHPKYFANALFQYFGSKLSGATLYVVPGGSSPNRIKSGRRGSIFHDLGTGSDREAIKVLHTNGLIRKDNGGNVEFWVPYYKKRLYNTFYPYTNGEKERISGTIYAADFFYQMGSSIWTC